MTDYIETLLLAIEFMLPLIGKRRFKNIQQVLDCAAGYLNIVLECSNGNNPLDIARKIAVHFTHNYFDKPRICCQKEKPYVVADSESDFEDPPRTSKHKMVKISKRAMRKVRMEKNAHYSTTDSRQKNIALDTEEWQSKQERRETRMENKKRMNTADTRRKWNKNKQLLLNDFVLCPLI